MLVLWDNNSEFGCLGYGWDSRARPRYSAAYHSRGVRSTMVLLLLNRGGTRCLISCAAREAASVVGAIKPLSERSERSGTFAHNRRGECLQGRRAAKEQKTTKSDDGVGKRGSESMTLFAAKWCGGGEMSPRGKMTNGGWTLERWRFHHWAPRLRRTLSGRGENFGAPGTLRRPATASGPL